MPRTKKVTEEIEQIDTIEVTSELLTTSALEFNREDLNSLRDKVNEIINYLNKYAIQK